MDTIGLKFVVNNFYGEYQDVKNFEALTDRLRKIRYCFNFRENDSEVKFVLSYPRYFSETNAYLIQSAEECLKVNYSFISDILREQDNDFINWFYDRIDIYLIRVDIPFTYLMKEYESFSDYENVFKMISSVFRKKNKTGRSKSVSDFNSKKIETLNINKSNTKGQGNSGITIYNQNVKIEDIYPRAYRQALNSCPDLKRRIRIELFKRINRKPFTPDEFKKFDIYGHYINLFADDLLENLFDENILDRLYNEKIDMLADLLLQENKRGRINYQNFVIKYIDEIWDYEILRKALRKVIDNDNSYYQACKSVKGILEDEEDTTGIKYFRIKRIIESMERMFINVKRKAGR